MEVVEHVVSDISGRAELEEFWSSLVKLPVKITASS